MSEPGILVAGQTIAGDLDLLEALSKISETIATGRPSAVEQTLQRTPGIRLILLEITRADFDAGLLQRLRHDFPEVQILLINGAGDRDLLALAFSCGIKDAFLKPINRELLVERVAVLYRASSGGGMKTE